jgi:cobalt-zinc-cadmium efflux system outer membrane protein
MNGVTPRTAAVRTLLAVLAAVAGCQTARPIPLSAPQHAAGPPPRARLGAVVPCSAQEPQAAPDTPTDLPGLWRLALANNPSLHEAAAEVDASAGAQIQAGKYPNPRFVYSEDTIGSRSAPAGNLSLQLTQEIVTGGKRRLDVAIAGRETDAARLALVGRRFEVLTRLRRAYYGYVNALDTVRLNDAAVESLEKGVATLRKVVEAQAKPKTDLLRLEALLEETRISQARAHYGVRSAWKQVAAEVGMPELPLPATVAGYAPAAPVWEAEPVWYRVRAANAALQQAATEADRARLAVERARAEALPNVTVGAGYTNAAVESTAGAIISVETTLPLWDRKQGLIHEAEAKSSKAQAAVRTQEATLSASTAEAFARYQGAARQVEKLQGEVLPRLQESLDLLLKGYEAGAGGVTFTDMLTTEQSLLTTRLTLAEARQNLWQAVADLEGLMQVEAD